MVKAAARAHIPTAVHESNIVPGLTTKMLENYADLIMVGFEDCRRHYRHPERIAVTGTPVRGDFGVVIARLGHKAALHTRGCAHEQHGGAWVFLPHIARQRQRRVHMARRAGLIGACVIMIIFALLILRGFWASW